jgi:uridylate kinase
MRNEEKSRAVPFHRVLLKLSGETLTEGAAAPSVIHSEACLAVAQSIKLLISQGVQVGVVMGGGNIFRGLRGAGQGMSRTPADQIGMLATLINGVALQQALESIGCPAALLTALECPRVAETFTLSRASHYFQQGRVCLFAGGTGNPYFTTDTAAALRASEIGADAFLKATKVDGVYSADPLKNSQAIRYDQISYSRVLADNLEVMDAASIALCMNAKIPIFVFHMQELKNPQLLNELAQGIKGTRIGI